MKVEILQLKSPNSGRQSAKKLADFKRRKCKSYANEEYFFLKEEKRAAHESAGSAQGGLASQMERKLGLKRKTTPPPTPAGDGSARLPVGEGGGRLSGAGVRSAPGLWLKKTAW